MFRLDDGHMTAWTKGLNHYYRDPLAGTILSNHVFVFGDSNTRTMFKRQMYRDAIVEEYDLLPTNKSSRICVGLTADDRAEDIQNLPHCLDKLPNSCLTAKKANECENKIRPFAPIDAAYKYYKRMESNHKE